jgi:hypothetical protein
MQCLAMDNNCWRLHGLLAAAVECVRTGDKHALVIAARALQAQFAARWTDLAPELMRIKDDARRAIRDRRQVLLRYCQR